MAAFTYQLKGADSHRLGTRPAPPTFQQRQCRRGDGRTLLAGARARRAIRELQYVARHPGGSTGSQQGAPGIDYLQTYPEWLVLQTGVPPFRAWTPDPTPKYIYSGRALAEWCITIFSTKLSTTRP